jgi:hypothetical protein
MSAPVASGWSESPGGACTHWKAPPCHGARGLPTFTDPVANDQVAPITVIGQASIELVKSTHVRHPRNIILRPKAVTR